MSYTSLSLASADGALTNRVNAAVQKEARNNAALAATDYGKAVQIGQASPVLQFAWPVAVATEAAYEFAINSGNLDPGGDPTVITDADILASVQANWPPDPWPPPMPVP